MNRQTVKDKRKTVDLSPGEFLSSNSRFNDGSRTVSVDRESIVENAPAPEAFQLRPNSCIKLNRIEHRVVQQLGRGGYGGVALAERKDPEFGLIEVVVKYAFDGREAALRREAEYMKKIEHPGVVQLIDSGTINAEVLLTDDVVKRPLEVLVEERLFENPYIYFGRKPLPPQLAIDIYVNLLRTLEDIHRAKFIHGDIKPDNILLRPNMQMSLASRKTPTRRRNEDEQSYGDRCYASMVAECEYQPVLGDLGSAIDTADKKLKKYPASPAYLSPESLLEGRMGPARDVYALTVSFIELLTGAEPYAAERKDKLGIMNAIDEKKPPFDAQRLIGRVFDRLMNSEECLADKAHYANLEQLNRDLLRIVSRGLEANPAARASSYDLVAECITAFKPVSSTFVDFEGWERQRWTQTVLPQLRQENYFFKRKNI